MSNMKHDAIVQSGIHIHERIPIPEDMIPNDSRVEIDAKINAGYFTTGKQYTMAELAAVRGRGWEKWEDVTVSIPLHIVNRTDDFSIELMFRLDVSSTMR